MAGKPRARRNKETQELEPPWANIRRQWAEIDTAELQRRHDMAALLIAGRLPADWWPPD